jgi:hypothetical protein
MLEMKRAQEVLLKSFGNGIAMLRFQSDQTAETATSFIADFGQPVSEFVIGDHRTEVFLLLDEGHRVTWLEVRNTDDEWDALVAAVRARGSAAFWKRVEALGDERRAISAEVVS